MIPVWTKIITAAAENRVLCKYAEKLKALLLKQILSTKATVLVCIKLCTITTTMYYCQLLNIQCNNGKQNNKNVLKILCQLSYNVQFHQCVIKALL